MFRIKSLRTLFTCACTLAIASAFAQTTATQRIVSLNGSVTEIICALGAEDQLVGRDESSYYPPSVAKLPSVGYQFQVNAEGVLSLKPTLVIGRTDVKPANAIEQIKAAGARVELIDEPRDFTSAIARVRTVGKLIGRTDEAEKIASEMETELVKLRKRIETEKPAQRVALLYLRGPQVQYVLGSDTGAGALLKELNVTNVFEEITRPTPITTEAMIAAKPDVLLAYAKGLETVGGAEGLLKIPGIAQTPAGKAGHVVSMDDLKMSGFGPRSIDGANELLDKLQRKP